MGPVQCALKDSQFLTQAVHALIAETTASFVRARAHVSIASMDLSLKTECALRQKMDTLKTESTASSISADQVVFRAKISS